MRRLKQKMVVCLVGAIVVVWWLSVPKSASHYVMKTAMEWHDGSRRYKTCAHRPIITAAKIGRLGNNMMTYANLYGIARKYNLIPYWPYGSPDRLEIFKNLVIPDLQEVIPDHCEWLTFPTFDHFVFYLQKGLYNGSPVFIKGFSVLWQFEEFQDEIRTIFQFKDDIKGNVQRKLQAIRKKTGKSIFVGVHCRGTDYAPKFYWEYHSELPGEVYYQHALNYMRSKYKDVGFLVVSDDLKRCMRLLNGSGHVDDIYTVGNGDLSSPGEDMALLVTCNHTVLSVGTFGFWSAYLDPNKDVLYPINYKKINVTLKYHVKTWKLSNFILPSYMKNWIGISAT